MDNTEEIHLALAELFSTAESAAKDFTPSSNEEELAALQRKIIELEKKNFQLVGQSSANERHKVELLQTEITLKQTRIELSRTQEELAVKENTILSIHNEVGSLKKQIASFETKNDRIFVDFQSEKEKIEKEAFEFITANSDLQLQVVRLKNRVDELNKATTKAKAEAEEKSTAVAEIKTMLSKKETERHALLSQILNFEKELASRDVVARNLSDEVVI